MDPKVLNFISRHRISSLATPLLDGSIHSATMHYCHQEDPLTFYFLTEKGSRKCQRLLDHKDVLASLVIGFSEEEWATLQLEGNIKLLTESSHIKIATETFCKKFPSLDPKNLDENDVFLKFTPTWWRYTELKKDPKVTISSEDGSQR